MSCEHNASKWRSILLGSDFLESDVVEWVETIWSPKRTRRKKAYPWGKQKVTAQISSIEGVYLKLTVLKSEIMENNAIKELIPHKVGTVITKKQSTLLRGNPERLLWSEEGVRANLMEHPVQQ